VFNSLKKIYMDHQSAFIWLAILTAAFIVYLLMYFPNHDEESKGDVKRFYVEMTATCRYAEIIHASTEHEARELLQGYIERGIIAPCITETSEPIVKPVEDLPAKRRKK
jgi:hypothetical protein